MQKTKSLILFWLIAITTTSIVPACRKICKKLGFRVERISSERLNQHLRAAQDAQRTLDLEKNLVQETESMNADEQKHFSSLSCCQKFTLLMFMGAMVHSINLTAIALRKRFWNA